MEEVKFGRSGREVKVAGKARSCLAGLAWWSERAVRAADRARGAAAVDADLTLAAARAGIDLSMAPARRRVRAEAVADMRSESCL